MLFYEQPSQIQCSQALHTRMILNDPVSLPKQLRNFVRFEACFLTIFLAVHVCCAQSPLHSTHDTLGYSLEEHIEVQGSVTIYMHICLISKLFSCFWRKTYICSSIYMPSPEKFSPPAVQINTLYVRIFKISRLRRQKRIYAQAYYICLIRKTYIYCH